MKGHGCAAEQAEEECHRKRWRRDVVARQEGHEEEADPGREEGQIRQGRKGLLEHGAQANWCFKLVSQFSKHLGLPEWCNAKEKPEMLLMLLS